MKRETTRTLVLCMLLAVIFQNIQAQTVDEKPKAILAFVNASSDDAVENLDDGTINTCEENLSLLTEFSHNLVGIRFSKLNIPQGSVITSARLVYRADQIKDDWTNLMLCAEYSDNATTFEDVSKNISERQRTKTTINWTDRDKWTHTNGWFTSPNITELVQEVINRSGWEANNSLALLIEGNGERTMVSYDGNPMTTPMLVVKFIAKKNVYSQTFNTLENDDLPEESTIQ